MVEHVSKRTRPDLDWRPHPRGLYMAYEMLQSDAYRSLSKFETDLVLFILSLRKFPSRKTKMKKKQGEMDYWSPLNGYDMTIPFLAILDAFNKPGGMRKKAPAVSTITRALKTLMHVGFISVVGLGGNGKGDMTRYRIEHNWRTWKEGDGPCFTKEGMTRAKGFCIPGSGEFCPARNCV